MAVFIFMLNVSFSFSTFLNLGAQIRGHQNRYTNFKLTLDQLLILIPLKLSNWMGIQ